MLTSFFLEILDFISWFLESKRDLFHNEFIFKLTVSNNLFPCSYCVVWTLYSNQLFQEGYSSDKARSENCVEQMLHTIFWSCLIWASDCELQRVFHVSYNAFWSRHRPRMSGPWWKPGRDWEQEEATFPAILTSVPRWHSMVVDLGNGDRGETFTTTTQIENLAYPTSGERWLEMGHQGQLFSCGRLCSVLGLGFPIADHHNCPQQYYKGSTMIELSQITMNSQSARSETKMENALQPIRCFLSWRIPLTTCWGWAWIQEWIEKDNLYNEAWNTFCHWIGWFGIIVVLRKQLRNLQNWWLFDVQILLRGCG